MKCLHQNLPPQDLRNHVNGDGNNLKARGNGEHNNSETGAAGTGQHGSAPHGVTELKKWKQAATPNPLIQKLSN